MIVYIDYIFIENLIMNYLLLCGTKNMVKENAKKIRIILASIIGSIYVCVIYILQIKILTYSFCKLLLTFVMVYITFIPKKISIYLKEIFIFYFISILNTGTYMVLISIFNLNAKSIVIKIIIYILGYFFIKIIQQSTWKMFKTNLKKSQLIYDVYLKNGNKYVCYKGFIDTGNTSKDIISGKPIFYASKKQDIDLSKKEEVNIEINTVKGKGNIKGYVFDNLIIQKGENIKFTNAVICFTEEIKNNLGYDMILNYDTYEEELGGIYI